MSTTLNQLIYDLKNIVRGGLQSDDEIISDEQVAFWIKNTRAQLIKQQLDKKKDLSQSFYQTLCTEVEAVDASACCNIDVDCTIVKSKVKIPRLIDDNSTIVKPVDITSKPYSIIPFSRVPWVGTNKFTKNVKRVFFLEDYLYIMNDDLVEKISIHGVFEDPQSTESFLDCDNKQCFSYDNPYPISSAMIEIMKEMIIKNNFRIALAAPTDAAGDAKHTVQPTTEQQ